MALKFVGTKIIPSALIFISLIISAILLDFLFHLAGLVWIGRYLGIAGTFVIIASFIYSLRKRKIIKSGSPKRLLQNHELQGWIGALLILVHGGVHFNAVIPWLALFAMVIVVASGLTGKYLLKQAKERLKDKEAELVKQNKTTDEIEKELLYSSLLVDTMQKWRKVHMPLTMIFIAFALIHIIVTLLMWRW
ncbi:MAG: hypothetical protein IPM56_01415 [Ignavibacteriales bacterium]|nr:MAG: hypothetical protein IPM56_01415 [Ignavibacteriales bacterium]